MPAVGRDLLDSRRLVALAMLGALALLVGGGASSPHVYGERAFIVDHVRIELLLAAWVGLLAIRVGPHRIGWRRPRWVAGWQLAPLALLMAVTAGAWLVARRGVPTQGATTAADGWLLLRTTLLVGLNEETLFRGLLLAAMARWWGLRRGALVSTLCFGLFHLSNVLAGVAPAQAVLQAFSTTLIGATFLMGTLALRSVWLAALCHGLYDALVFDIGQMTLAGGPPAPTLAIVLAGWTLGAIALAAAAKLRDAPPYDD